MKLPFYRHVLYEALSKRCKANARYSLRAFALALGVDPGNLSRAMRGRTTLSKAYTEKIIASLGLSPAEAELFRKSSKKKTPANKSKTTDEQSSGTFVNLHQKHFEVIADLLHYAILELSATDGFRPETSWIAKALGVSTAEASIAIQRLVDTDLLRIDGSKWKKCSPKIKTRGGTTTSGALRLHQKQVLSKAIDAVDHVPIDKRCNISITMPANPMKLELARKAIEEFSERLCDLLSQDERRQVYQLAISLYPLQKEPSV